MKKTKTRSLEETNPRVQRMTERQMVLSCPICPPNKGCNRHNRYFGADQNWKSYRTNQWKGSYG